MKAFKVEFLNFSGRNVRNIRKECLKSDIIYDFHDHQSKIHNSFLYSKPLINQTPWSSRVIQINFFRVLHNLSLTVFDKHNLEKYALSKLY